MNLQAIFNLIAFYFLELNISYLNVLNCWNTTDGIKFLRVTSKALLFVRNIRLPVSDFERTIDDICPSSAEYREGYVFEYNCPNASHVLNELSLHRCFTTTRYWLFFETDKNNLMDDFSYANLSVDAHITYAKPFNTSDNTSILFDLYDVYNNGRELGGLLNVTFDRTLKCLVTDVWSMRPLCKVIHRSNLGSLTFFQNRATLADITMPIGMVITRRSINQPESVLTEYLNTVNNTHLENFSRYGYHLTIIINEILKYNVTWIPYTSWTENYTSGGALSGLETGRAIQIAAPFAMVAPRLTNVQAIFQSATFRTIFLFRTPRNIGTGERFTKPFQSYVWLCMLGMLLLFSFGLRKIFLLEKDLNQGWTFVPSYLTVLICNFGELCQQSSLFMPKTSGGRISHVVFLISCFLLYNYYTSLLVAFLLGAPEKSNIKTMTQLADSNVEIGVENVTYHRAHFTSDDPEVVYFVQKKLKPKDPAVIWFPPDKGISRARNPGYAFLCEESIAYELVGKYFKPNQICDLNEVDVQSKKPLVHFIKKRSPYHDILKTKFLWMHETGLISKHHEYWFKSKPKCMSENVIESVSLEYAAPVFFVLGIGMGFSVLILFIEIGVHAIDRRLKINRIFIK